MALSLAGSLRLDRRAWVLLGQSLYVTLVAIVTSTFVGLATQGGWLLWAAVPLGVVLVAAMAWLPPRAQVVGWAAVTGWLLASVYLGHGSIEYVALVVVLALSAAGVFISPWFLVAVWTVHPLWDLIPRDLPAAMHDLPHACLIYDLIVAAYLFRRTRRGFFPVIGAEPGVSAGWRASTPGGGVLRTGMAGAAVLVTALVALVTAAVPSGGVAVLVALPLAVAVIAALARLSRPAQPAAWALVTGWVGMTYAHSGAALEIALFLVIVVLAVLGVVGSQAYLALAWGLHALWNLAPHAHAATSGSFMSHWTHSPWAGVVFEGTVALYLLRSVIRSPHLDW